MRGLPVTRRLSAGQCVTGKELSRNVLCSLRTMIFENREENRAF